MGVTITDNFIPQTWGESYPETWGSKPVATWEYGTHDYGLLATKTLGVAEVLQKSVALPFAEEFTATEQFSKEVDWNRTICETVSLMETYWDVIQFRLSVSESVTITDNIANKTYKGVFVTLHIEDNYSKHTGKLFSEAVSVDDRLFKKAEPTISDGFAITDDEANRILKEIPDALHIAENIPQKSIGKQFSATIFVEDEFFRKAKTIRKFAETVSLTEHIGKNYKWNYEEAIEIIDFFYKMFTENIRETVSLSELWSKAYSAKRLFAETVAMNDFLKRNAKITRKELLPVRDTILQASNAILNNIYARHGEITSLEEFNRLVNRSPGFTEFINFKVGEYDYEEALVKIAVRSKMEQGKPTISNLTMHVDIPDTDDRGTTQITDTTAATRVLFNKHYYNPPEINVVLLAEVPKRVC